MRVNVCMFRMVRLSSISISIVCKPLGHLEQISVGVRDKGITIALVVHNLVEFIVGIQYWCFCSI